MFENSYLEQYCVLENKSDEDIPTCNFTHYYKIRTSIKDFKNIKYLHEEKLDNILTKWHKNDYDKNKPIINAKLINNIYFYHNNKLIPSPFTPSKIEKVLKGKVSIIFNNTYFYISDFKMTNIEICKDIWLNTNYVKKFKRLLKLYLLKNAIC